jgi:hypothetical protein
MSISYDYYTDDVEPVIEDCWCNNPDCEENHECRQCLENATREETD